MKRLIIGAYLLTLLVSSAFINGAGNAWTVYGIPFFQKKNQVMLGWHVRPDGKLALKSLGTFVPKNQDTLTKYDFQKIGLTATMGLKEGGFIFIRPEPLYTVIDYTKKAVLCAFLVSGGSGSTYKFQAYDFKKRDTTLSNVSVPPSFNDLFYTFRPTITGELEVYNDVLTPENPTVQLDFPDILTAILLQVFTPATKTGTYDEGDDTLIKAKAADFVPLVLFIKGTEKKPATGVLTELKEPVSTETGADTGTTGADTGTTGADTGTTGTGTTGTGVKGDNKAIMNFAQALSQVSPTQQMSITLPNLTMPTSPLAIAVLKAGRGSALTAAIKAIKADKTALDELKAYPGILAGKFDAIAKPTEQEAADYYKLYEILGEIDAILPLATFEKFGKALEKQA